MEVLAADSADEFADSCARLYSDERLWEGLRETALERVAAEYSPETFKARLKDALENGEYRRFKSTAAS
jgi:glycosyltransferase involved in cell wall biosynthesis